MYDHGYFTPLPVSSARVNPIIFPCRRVDCCQKINKLKENENKLSEKIMSLEQQLEKLVDEKRKFQQKGFSIYDIKKKPKLMT